MTAPALRRSLLACFTASGAAALIYQVAWVRLFTLALGHTVAASSTVLAAFMGGLAAGAWCAARAMPRLSRPLVMYAALELFIAAFAIILPFVLAAFDPLLAWAYADGDAPMRFGIIRVVVSLALLGVPAAAMGATYPLAVAWLTGTERRHATNTRAPASGAGGVLYAANSAGAAVGAIAAGFWLIEALGVRGTTWLAVALNVAAAAAALWLSRAERFAPQTARVTNRPPRAPKQMIGPSGYKPAAVAAALSGFAALVYEVTWTRLLALTLGPTTYAFAAMAAAFITGIAFGSTLGVRLGRGSNRAVSLGASLAATAVSTMVAAWFTASQLPLLIAQDVAAGTELGSLVTRQVAIVFVLLLPASICLGATFTLALAVAASDDSSTVERTATVYTINTVGAVAGALAAGFLLLPRFGLQTTFLFASVVLVAGSLFMAKHEADRSAHRTSRRRSAAVLSVAAIPALIGFAALDWDRDLITSGAYKYARGMRADDLEWNLRAGRLEYYREGAAGTVSVRALAGARALAIDGKVDASNAGDMLTQRLLGLLPTLLHSEPRDALVIGLGSGVTADAALASGDVRQLDVVEISPEVVGASAYFARDNHDVLNKPAVRLLIGDGRSHLRLSPREYDVIVSEPSNPWMAGVSALFTREFFEAARARLRPRGVFCQWSHTYEISESDLRSIVRTFASVFPDGTMWLAGEGDLLLIGSVDGDIGERITALPARSRAAAVRALLADLGMTPDTAPFVLLSSYAGGAGELARFGNGARVQTDDRTPLEFSAARAMFAPPPGNAERLRAIASSAVLPAQPAAIVRNGGAEEWTARGTVALRAEAFSVAHDSFRRAVSIDSRSARALRGSTDAAAGLQRMTEQVVWLKMLAAADPRNAPVRVELSRTLAMLGEAESAIEAAMDAVRIDPASPEPLEQLASIFADIGDGARLMTAADELVRRFPQRHEGRYYRAASLLLAERPADSEREVRALVAADSLHAKGHNLLGVVCGARGDRDCARQSFMRSLELDPRDPSVYVNLGNLRLESGDAAAAIGFFREALAVDPLSDAARLGIATARAAQEQ